MSRTSFSQRIWGRDKHYLNMVGIPHHMKHGTVLSTQLKVNVSSHMLYVCKTGYVCNPLFFKGDLHRFNF